MSAQAAMYTHTDDALQQDYSTHSTYSTFTTPQDVLHDYYQYPGSGQCYVPIASMPFEYRERPGCMHYLPPAAVSTRYYALHDPNVYLHECDKPTSVPSVPHDHLPHIPSPQPSDMHSDFHSSCGSPWQVDVRMTFSETITSAPLSPSAPQEFSAPSVPMAYGQPDLPKQRRNRDDPGGDTGLLAQPTALQCEDQMDFTLAYPTPEGTPTPYGQDQVLLQPEQECEEQKPLQQGAAPVPSQWKLGAALDRLRFPEYNGDWDTMIAKVTGRTYKQTFPRPTSPLCAEDTTRFAEMAASLGLTDPERAKTPTPPPTPASDVDFAHTGKAPTARSLRVKASKMVVYSPTTARRTPVRRGPSGPVLQITVSKKAYKRATMVACAFCRRRKIACGGPQEGDEAKRCG
ncbi:hypothetical protein C8Q74DRAFT_1367189 [Fomes fomentarius]|nr:hypothetical protein C8Q74DRAFT_1367189 [Fomes fomentarius]